MEKIEDRAVMKNLFLRKGTSDEITTDITVVYGDSVPPLPTIEYWTTEFKRGP